MVTRAKLRKRREQGPAVAPAARPARSYAAACALLAIGVFLLYAGSYRNPLVFDDRIINLVELPGMSTACATLQNRCLTYTTFGLTYLATGLDLFWFRAGNVLCHALASLACFVFLDRLFDAVRQADRAAELAPDRVRLLAFCGAMLYAVHPVTVYGVAYLVQRSIVMATLFSLFSLAAFVQALSSGRRRWLWISALLYLLALWSKEHAVMLPAVAVAIATLLHKRIPGSRLEWAVLAGTLLLAVAVVTFRLEAIIGSVYEYYTRELPMLKDAGAAAPEPAGSHLGSVVTQCFLFFKYLLLWLVPYPGWMSVDLRQPVATGPWNWPYWLGAAAFAAYGVFAALLVMRRGALGLMGVGLLFPWLLFFTEFATVRIQESFVLYRSYLWMAGLPAVLPFLAARLSPRVMISACAALALVFGLAMRDRLATFSGELALWNDVISKNTDLSLPFAERGYSSRAAALMREGRLDEALRDLDMALKLNARSTHAYVNRAMVLAKKGDRKGALADFDRAIELDRSFADAYSERCLLLIRMEEPERALESCNAALRLAPDLPAALLNRAVLHMRASRMEEALADVERVLRFEPASGIALYNRGRIFRSLGRHAESERDLRASCKSGFRPVCATLR